MLKLIIFVAVATVLLVMFAVDFSVSVNAQEPPPSKLIRIRLGNLEAATPGGRCRHLRTDGPERRVPEEHQGVQRRGRGTAGKPGCHLHLPGTLPLEHPHGR